MFRLLFKSVFVVLLVFFIGNYVIYLKTGQMPLRDLRDHMSLDWLIDVREGVSDKLSADQLAANAKDAMKNIAGNFSAAQSPEPVTVYRWTDEHSQVHLAIGPP